MTKKKTYDNDSISSLKGADRVRKRPGVIFGSDGLEGCEHAVFEILSNAIDEARAGYGRLITVTRFADLSIQVEDQGRGCPVDWNEKEGRYNWELVFCELYAGGKYDNENSDNYEYSLGLNGLGSCATQYASRYMDVTVCRDGKEYRLHFERGEIAGEMRVTELKRRHTGSTIRWLPDLEVFTDIDIPADYYREVLRRQAVVNAGRLMKETGCDAVKLEGGREVCDQIRAITAAGIPVCAHVGMTPQSHHAFGGFKVQGKGEEGAARVLADAMAVQAAGAFAVVLECVPPKLAALITRKLDIITIGIGAGAACDGQVLVWQDMLAMGPFTPKFVKHFAQVGQIMTDAFQAYDAEVKDASFPAAAQTYAKSDCSDEILERLEGRQSAELLKLYSL